jgi:hypothetical protein
MYCRLELILKFVGYRRVVVLYNYSTQTIIVWHCFSLMCLLLVESDEGMNVWS